MKFSSNLIRAGSARSQKASWSELSGRPASALSRPAGTEPPNPTFDFASSLPNLPGQKDTPSRQLAHPDDQPWEPEPLPVFPGQGQVPSRHNVITRRDLPDSIDIAAQQAEGILEDAHQQAAQILEAAHQQAEETRRLAREQGLQEARAELRDLLRQFQAIVQEAIQWREQMLARSEEDLISMVETIAKKMFWEGYSLNPTDLHRTLDRVVAEARSLGNLRLFLNPADARELDPYWREAQVTMHGKDIQIIPSDDIARGGCFISGQWGDVDARLETQLQAVVEALSQVPGLTGGSA